MQYVPNDPYQMIFLFVIYSGIFGPSSARPARMRRKFVLSTARVFENDENAFENDANGCRRHYILYLL